MRSGMITGISSRRTPYINVGMAISKSGSGFGLLGSGLEHQNVRTEPGFKPAFYEYGSGPG